VNAVDLELLEQHFALVDGGLADEFLGIGQVEVLVPKDLCAQLEFF
jgi:hypothetical protein